MLHTKFHGNRPAGSGKIFEGFLPNMGMAAICDKHFVINFLFSCT